MKNSHKIILYIERYNLGTEHGWRDGESSTCQELKGDDITQGNVIIPKPKKNQKKKKKSM
jgi:hypothetical protein